MERLMEFTDSETQAPDDLTDLETAYNSPPPLAQECKSYKWKIQLTGNSTLPLFHICYSNTKLN